MRRPPHFFITTFLCAVRHNLPRPPRTVRENIALFGPDTLCSTTCVVNMGVNLRWQSSASLKGGRRHAPWRWFAPQEVPGGGGESGKCFPILDNVQIAPPLSRKTSDSPDGYHCLLIWVAYYDLGRLYRRLSYLLPVIFVVREQCRMRSVAYFHVCYNEAETNHVFTVCNRCSLHFHRLGIVTVLALGISSGALL